MSLAIASGWSPAGAKGWCNLNGLLGKVTSTGKLLLCKIQPSSLADERAALAPIALPACRPADGAPGPDPGRHRILRRRPEPEEGQPRGWRLHRRQRQGPAPRVRARSR